MNTVAIIGRMLLALVFVLGLMWCLARWVRKPTGGAKTDRVMTVLARQQISRTSSVAVLRVMDRALVLGVTEQGVRLITETQLGPIEEVLADTSSVRYPRLWRPRNAALELDGAELAGAELDGFELDRAELSAAELDGFELSGAELHDLDVNAKTSVGRGLPPAITKRGALDGSVLSLNTWRQVLSSARDLTVRR